MIEQLREKLALESDPVERGYIIDQISLWENKLEIEPRGVDRYLVKHVEMGQSARDLGPVLGSPEYRI